MRHPDDGNLAALDAHLLEVEEGERRAEDWTEAMMEAIDNRWEEVMDALGQDTIHNFLYGVYMETVTPPELMAMAKMIHSAIEATAERHCK